MSISYANIQIRLANGQFVDFAREQIVSANVVEEFNAIAEEVPSSILEFKVIDRDGSLSMFDGALYEQLVERLPVFCYQFVEDDYRLVGKFYLDSWRNLTEKYVEFTAIDIIGVLAATDFDGIFWESDVPLATAMADVFGALNTQYVISSELSDVEISGWIPPGSYRDALQQICFASGAMAITARREQLHIVPSTFPTGVHDAKIDSRVANSLSIEMLPLVSSIELVSHNYTQSAESETIFDKTLAAGNHKIVFDKPYFDISIDGLGYIPNVLGTEGGDYIATEDGDYIEAGGEFKFGTNSVHIYLSEEAHVTITGTPWIDSKRSFIFNEPGVTPSTNKKTLIISNATLVNFERAQAILERLRDYYRQRYIQTLKMTPTTIRTGDIVLSNTFQLRKILSSVQKMEIDLTGGYFSTMTLRGFLPNYVLPIPNPVRRPRTGLAVCNGDLTWDNRWRLYA